MLEPLAFREKTDMDNETSVVNTVNSFHSSINDGTF